MAARITEDITESPPRPDLSLCEKCHTWNDVEFLSSEPQYRINYRYEAQVVDIPLHSARPDCAICQAVYVAAETRLEWEQSEGRTHTNSLVARNLGPLVMGNKSTLEDRWDDSRLGESRLLVAMYIIIYELAESSLTRKPGTGDCSSSKSEAYRNIGYRELLKLAPRFCLRYTNNIPTHLTGVQPWESPFFNVNLLKNWVSSSERVHSVQPSPPTADNDTPPDGTLPADFRLIDVQSMNLKRPKPGERFVALSYMWQNKYSEHDTGQLKRANLHSLEAVNGLENTSLPDVIADTIALCRALGERYLWVDRFCIVQDDETSKHEQIRAMHFVYSSAKFTIMAALNKYKTSVGLPGCPKLPGCPGRPRLPSAMDTWQHNDFRYRNFQRQLFGNVDVSVWNQRAWTFQERFLSHCRLFITESQAIFQYNGGQYTSFEHLALSVQELDEITEDCEDEARDANINSLTLKWLNDDQSQDQRRNRFLGLDNFIFLYDDLRLNMTNSLGFVYYITIIYKYTRRQLSFRSDILNAFAGIGGVLAQSYKTRILFGLPERYFHFALRWAMPPLKNLADWEAENAPSYAPSWSWASTQCSKDYSSYSVSNLGLDFIHFYYYDSGPSDLPQPLKRVDTKEQDERGPRWQIGHTALQRYFSQACTVLAEPACQVARRLKGSLVFNTMTIFCRLSPLGRSRYGGHPESYRLFSQALLAQPSNRSMGEADVDCKWTGGTESRAWDEIKVVVIAVRQLKLDEGSQSPTGPRPEVMDVLLVEPHPREPHALRRIGIGEVRSWELWQSCNPQWETVVLC